MRSLAGKSLNGHMQGMGDNVVVDSVSWKGGVKGWSSENGKIVKDFENDSHPWTQAEDM